MNPFAGIWMYRSYHNVAEAFGDLDDPQNLEAFKNSLFAEAKLILEVRSFETLGGRLDFGDGVGLDVKGSVSYGNPFAVRLQGVGRENYATGWIYDYFGYLVPTWPHGVLQVPAIVGSVIRTVDHSEGQAKAGKVASFVAVRTSE